MENNTIYLSKTEQAELKAKGTLTIERKGWEPAPKHAIIYGKGYGRLFDKIALQWVYGDVDRYIIHKAIDPNYAQADWFSQKGFVDEFGDIGHVHVNGTRSQLMFKVTDIEAAEILPKGDNFYLYLKITIQYK